MAVSFATIDSSKMELSPMRVMFKAPAAMAAVDLGGSLGNIVIETKYTKAPIKADQMGGTVLDRRVSGIEITVTTELTQVEDKSIWKVVFPHIDLETVSGATAVQVISAIGDGDLANAGELTLHPLSKADGVLDFDYLFPLACASAESSITMGPDNQARLKIVWNILPDTSVTPATFFIHGDPAVFA